MKEVTLDELRQLQIGILNAVHDFCKENNITYSLAYGTLLGAARHKGYIPWDDDIDIMMPREDYDRFLSTFKHPLYKTFHAPETEGLYLTFAKVIDPRIDLIENGSMKLHLGAYIDIFPFDNYPGLEQTPKSWFEKYKEWTYRFAITNYKYSIRHPRGMISKFVRRALFGFIPMEEIVENIQQLSIKFNDKPTKYKALMSSPWITDILQYPATLFDKITELEFEGRKYNAIASYDQFLTLKFGDWHQLPPPEQRVTHHEFKAYWK